METRFTRHVGIEVPLICGAMYPCSNPELVAAVSEAGGIGIIQPLSMVYVHKHDFEQGMKLIRRLTSKPVGLNVLTEKSLSRVYEKRMRSYVEVALQHGVRMFVTALGNPRWVVDTAHAAGAVVYHDVVERKWADKALDAGVDGLICVNGRAGGHAGRRTAEELYEELGGLGVPLICAGGIGDEAGFQRALRLGYDGVQMGTRFIATHECLAHADYKNAILRATEDDIVLTERITGVPVAVIRTPYIDKVGTKAGPLARRLLQGATTRHWVRAWYSLRSAWLLKDASLRGMSSKDFFQAGRSVSAIHAVESAASIVRRCASPSERPATDL
jgi:nitronate monooxygenase